MAQWKTGGGGREKCGAASQQASLSFISLYQLKLNFITEAKKTQMSNGALECNTFGKVFFLYPLRRISLFFFERLVSG